MKNRLLQEIIEQKTHLTGTPSGAQSEVFLGHLQIAIAISQNARDVFSVKNSVISQGVLTCKITEGTL